MFYFLDVDGVLNRESDWRIPFTVNEECLKNFVMLGKSLNISEPQFPHPENGWPSSVHRLILWDGASQMKEAA